MSKLIKNTFTILILLLLIFAFAKYQWHFLSAFKNSEILIVLVLLGFVGSFLELFVIKFGDLKKRTFFQVNAKNVHHDVFKIVELLSVRLALTKMPSIEIFSDSQTIIKIIYKNFNLPTILISTKCLENYSAKELEFALALKLASIKNGNDSALKIYRGFVGLFCTYPAAIIKSLIEIEQSKNEIPTSSFAKLIYIVVAVFLSLSGGFFAQLYLLFVEYFFDWNNYQLALKITKNKEFSFRHLQSEKIFSGIKLKIYFLFDQFLFDIQARLNR
jgi:Zn-dependent protease with chaperone function